MSTKRTRKSTTSTTEPLQLTDANGDPVDLTARTTVQFNAKNTRTGFVIEDEPLKVSNPTNGDVEIVNSMDTYGTWEIEVKIEWNDNTTDVVPEDGKLELEVQKSL